MPILSLCCLPLHVAVDDDDEDFFAEFNVGADDLDDDAPAAAKKAPAKPTFSNTGTVPAALLLLAYGVQVTGACCGSGVVYDERCCLQDRRLLGACWTCLQDSMTYHLLCLFG
jgi:hypothetical protein